MAEATRTADQRLRREFEAYWRSRHSARHYPRRKWLQRYDSTWGDPGYAQPTVHCEWLIFVAGVYAGQRMSK